jgi:lipoyl(octanoyl) transferase
MMQTLKIIMDGPRDGAFNMAEDARLLAEHNPGDEPILRIYQWRPAAVSSGYHQPDTDFDFTRIESLGFDFVHRPTGGRAILHADELTYAVIGTSPSLLFGESLHHTYMKINDALLAFLLALGIRADISDGESLADARGSVCFKTAGRHEITVGGRKIIGSAQRRSDGVFLQHGSILMGPAHIDLLHCLSGTQPGFATPEDLRRATTDLRALLGPDDDALQFASLGQILADAFAAAWNLEPRS